jgi:hypothetical protein
MKDIIKALEAIASNEIVSHIDSSSNINVSVVRQLFEEELIDAIDMSDLEGDCFDDVRINIKGHEWLKQQELTTNAPWWKSFDRRIAVIGVLVSVIALYLGLR